MAPVRSPSSSAARKVFAQTIRTAVARSAQAAVPSCRLVMARYGSVGLSSPGRVMGSSSRADRQSADRQGRQLGQRQAVLQVVDVDGWPHFGRTRELNIAACCALVSTVSPGQQLGEQVAGARDTVYGSEDRVPRA